MSKWSQYQLDVIDFIKNDTRNLTVNAVPGSGKTTTIVEATNHINLSTNKTGYIVFNSKNAKEAKAKLNPLVAASTIHSLGMSFLRNSVGGKLPKADEDKDWNLAVARVGNDSDEKRDLVASLVMATSLAKAYLVESPEDMQLVYDRHEDQINIPGSYSEDEFTDLVLKLMQDSIYSWRKAKKFNFDDMIWLPVKLNLVKKIFDTLLIDESQDLSFARIMMSISAAHRIGAVGDPRQACYSFAGAAPGAFEVVRDRVNGVELPLSICYRCDRNIIAEADKIIPGIEAAENAGEGIISNANIEQLERDAKAGEFILSRYNAPLLGMCMRFIRSGKPANIQGRDVSKGLLALVKSFSKEKKSTSVSLFQDYVNEWENKKLAEYSKKNKKPDFITDKADCLRYIADGCSSIDDIKTKLNALFIDTSEDDRIMLSTIHRSKGLEKNKVWLMTKGLSVKSQEEKNLQYIAITRAKHELSYVSGDVKTSDDI